MSAEVTVDPRDGSVEVIRCGNRLDRTLNVYRTGSQVVITLLTVDTQDGSRHLSRILLPADATDAVEKLFQAARESRGG